MNENPSNQPRTPEQEAISSETSPSRLWELVRPFPHLVAQNPNVPQKLLRQLSDKYYEREDILLTIIANPNVPEDLLLKLGERFPSQMLNALVFKELARTNTNLVSQLPIDTIVSLLRLEKIPAFLEEDLSKSPDLLWKLFNNCSQHKDILQWIAKNPNTPPKLLLQVGASCPQEMLDNPIFDLLLVENPNLVVEMPSATFISLMSLKEIPAFLKTPNLMEKIPSEIIESLLKSKKKSSFVSEWMSSCPERLQDLAKQDRDIALIVAQNPNAPSNLLVQLAHVTTITMEYDSYDEVTHTSFVSDPAILAAIAANPNTPFDLLLKLGADFPKEMASNPTFISSCLEDIQFLEKLPDATLEKLLILDSLPQFLLEDAINSRKQIIRSLITRNPNISIEMLKRLAQDDDQTVNEAATSNLESLSILERENRLAQDDDQTVNEAATSNLGSRKKSSQERKFSTYLILISLFLIALFIVLLFMR